MIDSTANREAGTDKREGNYSVELATERLVTNTDKFALALKTLVTGMLRLLSYFIRHEHFRVKKTSIN